MKRLLIIIGVIIAVLAVLYLTGCKAKKEVVVKKDSTEVRYKNIYSDSVFSYIDTSSHVHKDSSIATHSGITTITETGTFKGGKLYGFGTITTVKTHRAKSVNTHSYIDRSAIINHSEIIKDSTYSDSVKIKAKSKTISKSPDYTWLIIASIGGLFYFIIAYFEKKPKQP